MVSVHGRSWMVTANVTWGAHSDVRPRMVRDGHSDCDVHGYYDRGVHTVASVHVWSWMVTATVTSMDTMTEGCTQWRPSTDGHSYCDVHGYYDRGVHTVVSVHGRSWMVTANVTWGAHSDVRPRMVRDGHS